MRDQQATPQSASQKSPSSNRQQRGLLHLLGHFMTPIRLDQEENNTSTTSSVVRIHNSVQINWDPAENTCALKIFFDEVGQDA